MAVLLGGAGDSRARDPVVARTQAPSVSSPSLPSSLSPVLSAIDEALDAGEGERVLSILGGAAAEAPDSVVDLAASATLLAPWMAEDVATVLLSALPPGQRAEGAPAILAALLVAGQGRQAGRVAAAVRRAAPGADAALLSDMVRRLGRGLADDLVLADLLAEGGSVAEIAALRRGRAATLAGRRRIARLAADRPRPGPAPPLPRDDGSEAALPAAVEPWLDFPPRPPAPGDRPSPS